VILKRAGAGLVLGLSSLAAGGVAQSAVVAVHQHSHAEAIVQQGSDVGGIVQQPTNPGGIVQQPTDPGV
jgi:hypothetical protein